MAAAGLQDSTLDTSMELDLKLCKEEGDLLPDPAAYRTLVGSLVYLTITRPDISYAVQQVSQFMASPRHLHGCNPQNYPLRPWHHFAGTFLCCFYLT